MDVDVAMKISFSFGVKKKSPARGRPLEQEKTCREGQARTSMKLWLVSALVVLRPEVEAQRRTNQTGQSGKQLVQHLHRPLVVAMS